MTATSVSLLAATPSFPGEGRSSWIQRLCGDHQYSMRRLSQISGIKPVAGDWDRPIGDERWRLLLDMAGLGPDTCAESVYSMAHLHRAYRSSSFLLSDDGKPFSRWCPACLSTDDHPFLRWEWRLAGVRQCQLHGETLDETCPWCGSRQWLSRALLVDSVGAPGAPDLGSCGSCGMSLWDKQFCDDDADSLDAPIQEQLDELLTRLKQGYSRADDQLELDFDRYAHAIQPGCHFASSSVDRLSGNPLWASLRVSRTKQIGSPTLHIFGGSFVDKVRPPHEFENTTTWSKSLRRSERPRFARALALIRREMNELQLRTRVMASATVSLNAVAAGSQEERANG